MNPPQFFEIGRIVKSCGLKGRMKAVSYLESSDKLQGLSELYITYGTDRKGPFRLKDIGSKGKSFFLEIEGVEDLQTAKAFIGCQVLISADKMEKLPEGEYYWQDMIGIQVVTKEGRILGAIDAIFPTGSNDVYVCNGGDREILLPGTADVILKIDIDRGMMVVRLLEGL
jgi:16S rRNA processing protein RimM